MTRFGTTDQFSPSALDELLEREVAQDRDTIGDTATASAIQAAVGTVDTDLYCNTTGWADPETSPPTAADDDTPFDIASLTKAVVGSILAMQAVDEDLVDWQTPLAELDDRWAARDDDADCATFLHLLNHTSGLPDWRPFFDDHPVDPGPDGAEAAYRSVVETIARRLPLEGTPGKIHTYSDPGYILLTRVLERLFDDRLADLARRRIFAPLRLDKTTYVDTTTGDPPVADAVVTEDCPHRDRVLRGTVHDTNTNVIGGVSTHAGVFSTATDLLRFGRHLLRIDADRSTDVPRLVSRPTLQFAWSDAAGSTVGHHLAGWDTPSGERSSAGRGFGPETTVGHLGFTGTSLWIERQRGIISVLLTNRVYPSRDNDTIRDLRIAFQETIIPPTRHES